MNHQFAEPIKLSLAVIGGLALGACAEPGVALIEDDPSGLIFALPGDRTPAHNQLEICKDGSTAKIAVDVENSGSEPATFDFKDGECWHIGDDKLLGVPTDVTVAEWEFHDLRRSG